MMRELRAGALRLFWSRERERERDHGGVLACTMIGITDLLLGVESVLDQGASGTLGLIVECLIDQRRMLDSCVCWNLDSTVKVTSLFGGGLRRTSSPIFHSHGVRGLT